MLCIYSQKIDWITCRLLFFSVSLQWHKCTNFTFNLLWGKFMIMVITMAQLLHGNPLGYSVFMFGVCLVWVILVINWPNCPCSMQSRRCKNSSRWGFLEVTLNFENITIETVYIHSVKQTNWMIIQFTKQFHLDLFPKSLNE